LYREIGRCGHLSIFLRFFSEIKKEDLGLLRLSPLFVYYFSVE